MFAGDTGAHDTLVTTISTRSMVTDEQIKVSLASLP